MPENSYFQNALSNFTHEVASGGAIRHLTDLGYTAKQISEQLDFPTPFKRIQKEMWEHLVNTEVILLEEPDSRKREKVSYVREYDKFGKASFRRVVESEAVDAPILWREQWIEGKGESIPALLQERIAKNGETNSYVSCDLGLLLHSEPERFRQLLQKLEETQREYVEGIPWKNRRVYHRLDARMTEILRRLFEEKEYRGICYFLKTGEKLEFK